MVYCVLDFMFSSVVLMSRTAELVDRYSHTCRPSQSLRRLGGWGLNLIFLSFWQVQWLQNGLDKLKDGLGQVLRCSNTEKSHAEIPFDVVCFVESILVLVTQTVKCCELLCHHRPRQQAEKVCMVHLSKRHVYVQHLIWIKHKCSSKWNEFSSTVLWKMKRGDTEGLILTDS